MRRFVHCGTEAALMAGEPLPRSTRRRRCAPIRRRSIRRPRRSPSRPCAPATGEGFETVVLRPRFVWGPGDTTSCRRWSSWSRRAASPGSAAARTYRHDPLDNVVEGLLLAAAEGPRRRGLLRHRRRPVVFREFVSALLETQGVEPPSRSCRRVAGRGGARRSGGCCGSAATAAHPLRLLDLLPGMHDRHRQGPPASSATRR